MEHKKPDDQFYVIATSSLTEEKTYVLKHNESFGIFNKYGDIMPWGKSVQGIYYQGTRFLSNLQLKIENQKPLFLSSDIREDNEQFSVDLTNPDIMENNKLRLEKDTIHIMRKKVLWENAFYEQLLFVNYGLEIVETSVSLEFDNDFSDIFEVRGTERSHKGNLLDAEISDKQIILGYAGLDNKTRKSEILFSPNPDQIEGKKVIYNLRLAPGQRFNWSMTIRFNIEGDTDKEIFSYPIVIKKFVRRLDFINNLTCDIFTSNEQFNHWIERSKIDLITMITDTSSGPYPYAGIPWFSAPFGRDAIITAFECLWISPEIARGVLSYLALNQAREHDSFRDAEPGKILHEARNGEMANLNEIPFKKYYGSIDSTPLFIVLAGHYLLRTGDLDFIRSIWTNIELAIDWIFKYGDIDGDGFVEYARKEQSGLYNQGWKDSHDSVFFSNGELAALPIALCEVQGYVYDALNHTSYMAGLLNMPEKALTLKNKAEELYRNFQAKFWSEENKIFYLALAAEKRPCNVIASNAGHCLFSGIATSEQARSIGAHFLSKHMFSGWGIRTLSANEIRYNPMSYHNGSIWPHDNALIAYGFSKYGLKDVVNKIAAGLFDASLFIEGQRMPELFCGFPRRKGEAPTAYPVACSPQSWSVGSVFMIIQAMLGIEINQYEKVIRFNKPSLPDFIDTLQIRRLSFLDMKLDIQFNRTSQGVSIALLNKDVHVKLEAIF
ncbi:MAG TPA: glycogen debranching N-terminal domain-containing protein [Bacteroidales bacterium]|nr:glycogen debranching N-terminal domain-containing protein [Bacteroidales bacterium]